MAIIKNPQKYDSKLPTNVRLEAELKKRAITEAAREKVTLSHVINDALMTRYNLRKDGNK